MKKLFLMTTVISLLFAYSCKPKHEEMTFSFTNAEVTENSVDVKVTPSDLERNYFLGILPSTEVKAKDDAQIISEMSGKFKNFKGVQSYGLKNLQAETDYVALAFACDDAEKVARFTMKTLAVPEDPENPEGPETPEDPENPVDPEPESKLVLSVDKDSILANGEDAATFTVKLDDVLLSDGYQLIIVEDSTTVTNNVFFTTEAGIYTFVAIYNDITSNEVDVEAETVEEPVVPDPVVLLEADKTEIYNDGIDKVTFTVLVDGEIVTEGYQILNDNTPLTSNVFSTTEVGVYIFVAKYNDVASNEVKVEVLQKPDPVVELRADKKEIKNNGTDKVTFTVLVDGVDFTSESVIFNNTDNVNLEGNTFTSENAGAYVFSATYNGFKSEDVTITVREARAYYPGDLYEENGVRGVVFYVGEDGMSGLIMSMDETALPWSTEFVWVNCVTNRGDWHTEDMLKLGADKYPAAKWCADHGDGWYMPSTYELELMWHAVSNGKYEFDYEFVKLYNDKLDDPILEDYYWSSNETSEDLGEVVVFIDRSVVCLDPLKTNSYNVRAIRKF